MRDSRFFERALEIIAEAEERSRKLASGLYREVENPETGEMDLQRLPKELRPLCGAKTRTGGTCKARAVSGMTRCRMHGGLSTGPKTEAGRARIIESNRRRAAQRRSDVLAS